MRSIPIAVRTMSKDARVFVQAPVFRRLRILAMDPGIAARFESSVPNEVTLPVPWETLGLGPAGEYVAVVDEDDRGRPLNEPVNLDAPELLAQDGLTPSAGDPQFRQQMVYAVAMRTIRNFERALGRSLHWTQPDGGPYLRQLRLQPHALVEANAYFSVQRNAALFGFFSAKRNGAPSSDAVFLSMSPDVIAHTLTHAILLGLGFPAEGAGDLLGFHEGFADLVSTLQRFFPSDALREQLAAVQGDLGRSRTLGAIGLEFGKAMQIGAGLRNALGSLGPDGQWVPRVPDPEIYATATEPHERGTALFFAVFDAFHQLYDWRVADLRRIASKGTGELPRGEPHPDLVERFAREACTVARQLLGVCISALDYLPPVGFTFGDYLRALVTADLDANATDERRHRSALIESFRSYGIMPANVSTLAVDTLLWPKPTEEGAVAALAEAVRSLSTERAYWTLPPDRAELWKRLDETARELGARLATKKKNATAMLGPVDLSRPFDVRISPMERTRVSGQMSLWWSVRIVQRGTAKGKTPAPETGTTLIVDAASGTVRYQANAPPVARPRRGRASDPRTVSRATPHRVPPLERRLRVFAFDPSMGVRLETAGINEVTLRVPWERTARGGEGVLPGPVGEYVEVVDRDPASGCFYDPVDLNRPELMATDGLAPSESNPQFHQQMVYAVAMRTIRTFEAALGRLALWSPRRSPDGRGEAREDEYVQRLRIYPHALREANAYYSPDKKALLFGYFPAEVEVAPGAARPTVFTCLSQDVVAHEVTHALLDGMHRRFNEASNPDVLAFHEAFADLVALFQHFSLPDVLRHQIALTRGDLASQNRLGELAQQFGQAIGNRGALRSAIGSVDKDGEWHPLEADPGAYVRTLEPHDRGAILVAAVFDAFLTIYKARVADLLRIATDGSGVLPAGQLHPDVVNRLADEAARSARNVLAMCIRALDYCPPVDLTFGDYLRALLTADFDYDPEDAEHRRVAFVEAFRRRGIVPEDVRTLSADGLLWQPTSAAPDDDAKVVLEIVESWAKDLRSWDLSRDRRVLHALMTGRRAALHDHVARQLQTGTAILSAIDPSLPFEVHSIRPSIRSDFERVGRFQWVIELTQRVPQFLEPAGARAAGAEPDYFFRGGCTLLVDAESGKVRYSIKKPLDERRRERQRRFLVDEGCRGLAATYFGGLGSEDQEPFAMLHRL